MHTEPVKKASCLKLGSCNSFISLLILSSLVTLALSVFYVEVYHLNDINNSAPVIPIEAQPSGVTHKHNEADKPIENKVIDIEMSSEKMSEDGHKKEFEENVVMKEHHKDSSDANEIGDSSNIPEEKYNVPEDIDRVQANVDGDDKAKESSDDISNQLKVEDVPAVKNKDTDRINDNANSENLGKADEPKEKIETMAKTETDTKVESHSDSKVKEIESQVSSSEDKDELFKLYMEVEELTDDILSKEPGNEMIKQLAPHLETTLKDIELDRIAGIKEGLLHIRSILQDLRNRISENLSAAKIEQPSPQKTSVDNKTSDEGKEPVNEIIPDPIYIAPLGEQKAAVRKEIMEEAPKEQRNSELKSNKQVDDDNIDNLLLELKRESDKNPLEGIRMIDDALIQKPDRAGLLYLKARVLDSLSDQEKSNTILEQAIDTYQSIVDLASKDMSSVPQDMLRKVGLSCAEKMIFRGFQQKAVRLLQQMINFFPKDIAFKNKLGVAFLTFNEMHSAKHIFEHSLKLNPDDGFAQVHYGFILKSEGGNLKEAVKYLKNGIRSGAEGTSDGRFYFHLGDSLLRLNETEQARQIYEEGAQKGLFLNQWQRSLYNVDRLTSKPIWTQEETTYAQFFKKLENNWKKIKLEGVAALSLNGESGFRPEAENLKDTGDWRQFELFVRGKKDAKNCAKAPLTCRLVEEFLPAAGCRRGQVKFSVMQPNTHVWPHTGPTNCRLRAHLGLLVPDGVKMRIADKYLTWQEGKVIIFDDSWEHEVWHKGNSLRLVLIVDVWHPDLSESERRSLSAI